MIEKHLSGWTEYLEEVRCLARSYGDRPQPPLFRGLSSSDRRLETTLDRLYPGHRSFRQYYRKAAACKGAVEMLTGRRWNNVPDYGELSEEVNGVVNDDPDRLTTILTGRQEILEFL